MTVGSTPAQAWSRDRDAAGRSWTPLASYVRESGLQSLVIGLSRDPNAKVTILLVSAHTGRPVLAVKAPTTDVAASAVQAELRALAELAARLSSPLSETIPNVVDVVEFEGRPAVVMTAVDGSPMTVAYMGRRHTTCPARVAADFAAVGDWLAQLHRATAGATAPLEMDAEISMRLRRRFGDDPRITGDLELVAEVHERLRVNSVARTAVHGDFWFGNVLLTGGRVSGVVDWESAAAVGEPTRDLARFAVMYALYLDRRTRPGRRVHGHEGLRAGRWGAALEFAIDGSGWFPERFRRFVADGLAGLGASPDSWRDATLAGIAEVAALTDHPEFASHHLELFRRLARHGGARRAKEVV